MIKNIPLDNPPPLIFFDFLILMGIFFLLIGAGYLITTMFMQSESKRDTLHSLCLAIFFIVFGSLISLPNINNAANYNQVLQEKIKEQGIETEQFFDYRIAFVGTVYNTNKGKCTFVFPKTYPNDLKLQCH